MPSSARSIKSLNAWLLTGSRPVSGVEGAGEGAAAWEENGTMETLVLETGVPSLAGLTEDSDSLAVQLEAALVWRWKGSE